MPDKDWAIIFVLGIGWGASFFFNELILRDLGPVWVSFARVATGALGCWVYLRLTGRDWRVPRALVGSLALMGVLQFALPFAIYPIGQQYVASGVAGIVNALTPVMVVLVSHFWPGGERATLLKSLGVFAGFCGILLLTIPALGPGEETRLFGTLVLILSPLCYGVALNYVRRFHAIDPSVMLAWALSLGAILLLPVAFATGDLPQAIGPGTWVSIAVSGFVLTCASFIAAFRILPRAGATKTSTVTFVAPVSALLLGWLFLEEALSPLHFAGMCVIFLGLLLVDGRLFQGRRRSRLN